MIVMNFGSQDKKRNITMSKYRNIPLDVNDKDDGEKTRSPIADVSRGEQGRTKTTAIVKRDRVTSLVRRSAFTIIELLIVITVVSLLALLVVPVVSRAKGMAGSVQCKSNLRSLGQATFLFTIGNHDRLPNPKDIENPTAEVRRALNPHVGRQGAFVCPEDPTGETQLAGSYDWRYMGESESSLAGLSLDVVRNPAEIILGYDRNPAWHKDDWINVLYADSRVVSLAEAEWFTNMMLTVR
jgi:prepilin-type N-terminal cleavage/methylation domain-containing protein